MAKSKGATSSFALDRGAALRGHERGLSYQEYFSDGLAEELLNSLTESGGLQAVATALQIALLADVASKVELGGTANPGAFDAYLRALLASGQGLYIITVTVRIYR